MRSALPVALLLLILPASASAHYNMLLLSAPSVERGKEVTLTYQWGHPFEHELFDAPLPESFVVLAPDGKRTDLLKKLNKSTDKAGKKEVITYTIPFKPEEPGDYVFVLHALPIWMAAEGEFYQDTVKVVLHVQAQKGWDQRAEPGFELTPLTRPYGLVAGTVFQAQLARRDVDSGPAPDVLAASPVEIERYNAVAPKTLPADEFITRVVKTDNSGVVTCDLPDAGWWCLTASRDAGTKMHDGKMAPLRERTTFWVHVVAKPVAETARP
jgi:cobalt/nickel transport protein